MRGASTLGGPAVRIAAIVVVLLVGMVAALFATQTERPPVTTVPPTPAPTAAVASASPSPSPTPSASPAAMAPGAVTVQASRVAVPTEFRYLALGSGSDFRVIVLDLEAGRSSDVATIRLGPLPTAPAHPYVGVSASTGGRVVLLTLVVPETSNSVFILRPEMGDARLLVRGEVVAAIVSPDGTRFAIALNDQDRALTGLWVGTIADGAMKRLVADDPQYVGSPPRPYAFSPDGDLLVFGVGGGDSGARAMSIPVRSAEARVDRTGAEDRLVGGEAKAIGLASGAQFRAPGELLVHSSRSAFGGETVVYLHDLPSGRSSDLYRPGGDSVIQVASPRPGADQFATLERPICCGIVPVAVWLRDAGGGAKKLGEWRLLGETWWSGDGSRLYGRMGGDDSTGAIADLLTGRSVMTFCVRGGGPPPAPCT